MVPMEGGAVQLGWDLGKQNRLPGGAEVEGSCLELREHPVLLSQHSNPRGNNRFCPSRCVSGCISVNERDYRGGQLW